MKPDQLVTTLRHVASGIERSKNPDRNLVAKDLKKVIALLLNKHIYRVSPKSGVYESGVYDGIFSPFILINYELTKVKLFYPFTNWKLHEQGQPSDMKGTINIDGGPKFHVDGYQLAGSDEVVRSLTCDDPNVDIDAEVEKLRYHGSSFYTLLCEGAEYALKEVSDAHGYDIEDVFVEDDYLVKH